MGVEGVDFGEFGFVEEFLEAFACGEFASAFLGIDAALAASKLGGGSSGFQGV